MTYLPTSCSKTKWTYEASVMGPDILTEVYRNPPYSFQKLWNCGELSDLRVSREYTDRGHLDISENRHNTQNTIQKCWVFGLFPSTGILGTRKHDVSETESVSVLRCGGGRHLLSLVTGPVSEIKCVALTICIHICVSLHMCFPV
jgi:hypothetical protein